MRGCIARYLEPAAYLVVASLFLIGNIKFIKMVLTYAGVTGVVTELSVLIYLSLFCILLAYFFKAGNRIDRRGLVVFAFAAVLFALPYLINGMWYDLVQYAVFMVPFALSGSLIALDNNGIEKFFSALMKLSKVTAPLFIAYVLALFFCEPSSSGIFELEEMSYGDIAYAALPLLFVEAEYCLKNSQSRILFSGVRFLLYLVVLLYSGTRSAILCMVFALLALVILYRSNLKSLVVDRHGAPLLAMLACVLLCLSVVPAGARLDVIKDDLVREVGENGKVEALAYCVETGEYSQIDEVFEYYIITHDAPMSETEAMLRDDIRSGEGSYIVVPPEKYEAARNYHLPINNRLYLWSTSFGEFLESPVVGAGPLHYQLKYGGTFPHNILLETLSDFGLLGTVAFLFMVAAPLSYCSVMSVRHGFAQVKRLLCFIVTYIPAYLLYTSFYFNGILIFSVIALLGATLWCRQASRGCNGEEASQLHDMRSNAAPCEMNASKD